MAFQSRRNLCTGMKGEPRKPAGRHRRCDPPTAGHHPLPGQTRSFLCVLSLSLLLLRRRSIIHAIFIIIVRPTMLLRTALVLLLLASPCAVVEAFSSSAASRTSSDKVNHRADGEWIAPTFELDSVVQGPGHVLMYDTTLRGE